MCVLPAVDHTLAMLDNAKVFTKLDATSGFWQILLSEEVATAAIVFAALREVFSCHGIPEIVISDNRPQYSSELFGVFSNEYGFTHITSSLGYPQANGKAERAVATVKRLWKGEAKLQAYRATPLECGYSPSQLLMGRQLRTTIPQHPASLHPPWPNINGERGREE